MKQNKCYRKDCVKLRHKQKGSLAQVKLMISEMHYKHPQSDRLMKYLKRKIEIAEDTVIQIPMKEAELLVEVLK